MLLSCEIFLAIAYILMIFVKPIDRVATVGLNKISENSLSFSYCQLEEKKIDQCFLSEMYNDRYVEIPLDCQVSIVQFK